MTTYKHLETSIQIENGRVTFTTNNVEEYFETAHFGCDVADSDNEILTQVCEWLDNQSDMEKHQEIINDIINGDVITDENGFEWIADKERIHILHLGTWISTPNNLLKDGIMKEEYIPNEIGGQTKQMCSVLPNADCLSPVHPSEVQYKDGFYQIVK